MTRGLCSCSTKCDRRRRTRHFLACQGQGVVPDAVALAKGLAVVSDRRHGLPRRLAGALPLALTIDFGGNALHRPRR